ncbi:MAG: MraY family glycosyltransferase [Micrococcaceae bacterium]
MKTYLLVLFIAASVTYVCTPIVRLLARRYSILRPVRDRDVHTQPIPRLGGVAMFAGMCVAFIFATSMPFLQKIFAVNNQLYGVLAAGFVLVLLGIADDIWDLDWMLKLGVQIVAAAIMALQGIQLTSLPIGGIILGSSTISLALTIFVTLTTINAMNWVDGMDGLAAGIAAIGGLAFFSYAYIFSRHQTPDDYSNTATLVIAIMVGICLGFLPHNFHPARIFMGDTGAMLIGLLMAASAISLTGQADPKVIAQTESVPIFLPILLPLAVIALPLFDMATAILRRVMAGKSPTTPDKQHLHHKMMRFGHGHKNSVLVLYLWAAVVAFGTVAFAFFPAPFVIAMDVIFIGIAVYLTMRPSQNNEESFV